MTAKDKRNESVRFPSIEGMPDKPVKYPLNWKQAADRFAGFLSNEQSGVQMRSGKGNLHFTAFMEGHGHELITNGAIMIGKILRGEDVSAMLPSLWDYYHDEAKIFLNRENDLRIEYWYLMLVNALAAQIISRTSMDDEESVRRLRDSMDSLMRLAHRIGYDFNGQGYDFATNEPWTNKDSYRQPDAVGGYAYLMAFAHELFREGKYLEEAVTAMNHYQSFAQNPWYEIPSGAMACLAAARLNAAGYSFDLEKIIGFALDSEQGSLHVGQWGEQEINSLMRGWRGYSREESSRTAYSLETLILLPYLLPVVRYDPRFARSVGKYALHAAANASLFFSEHMPGEAQSRPDLTPDVPYETLHREMKGQSPYAAGDFFGHKSIYGGAYALWWGAVVSATDDPFILQLDVGKTDFFEKQVNPTYLYYNPWEEAREIAVDLGEGCYDVLDLTADREILYSNATGRVTVRVPAKEAVVIELAPLKQG